MRLAWVYAITTFMGCQLLNSFAADWHTHLSAIEPDPMTGTSKAVISDSLSLVHTTQILPFDLEGKIIGRDAFGQMHQALALLFEAISPLGCDSTSVAKLNIYISRANDIPMVRLALAQTFTQTNKPAVSFVVTALSEKGALVAIDAVVVPRLQVGATAPMPEPKVPSAFQASGIRPASRHVRGPLVYVSGMADTNTLPQATRITLGKLMSAIGRLGLGKSDVLQLKAFFQPMSEAAIVQKAIVDFFESNAPPTVFVEWISPAPNPPIEIELVAAGKPTNQSDSVVFLTPPRTTSTKVFSRVARVNHGKIVFISGLYGMKAQNPGEEVHEIFQSLGEILPKTGSDFEHLVKATYYVSDDLTGEKLNEIRPQFYNPSRPPAASKARVRGVAEQGRTVSIDMIAVTK
jgi:enamine deaminase RidA (YjgF/YER057c/UK114 family)